MCIDDNKVINTRPISQALSGHQPRHACMLILWDRSSRRIVVIVFFFCNYNNNNNNIYLKSNIHSIIRYKFSGLYNGIKHGIHIKTVQCI